MANTKQTLILTITESGDGWNTTKELRDSEGRPTASLSLTEGMMLTEETKLTRHSELIENHVYTIIYRYKDMFSKLLNLRFILNGHELDRESIAALEDQLISKIMEA
jgi:hypothetical protein